MSKATKKFLSAVKEAVSLLDLPAEVELHGSYSRDTWLPDSLEADVFLLLKKHLNKEEIAKLLEAIAERLPWPYEKSYAEHPYLKFYVEGAQIDLVPAFALGKIISAADRTPLHSQFLRDRLTPELRDEVRLLKRFLKGIGSYGAEIKVSGLSGYACELLIVHYGSFIRVLEALSSGRRIFIDFTGKWETEKALREFRTPIVVIDPVDPKRNVTSALSWETFRRISVAATLFLSKPSERFFLMNLGEDVVDSVLNDVLQYPLMVVEFEIVNGIPPDIYWGQGKRLARVLLGSLRQLGFPILNVACVADGDSFLMVFVGESTRRYPFTSRTGPPIREREHVVRFLNKWRRKGLGPFLGSRRPTFLVPLEECEMSGALRKILGGLPHMLKPSFTKATVVSKERLRKLSSSAKLELVLKLKPLDVWYPADEDDVL